MKKLLCLLIVFTASYWTAACTHTIRLTDTYGDGWNGGIVKVQVNGVDVLTNVGSTFTTGFGPINVTFNANSGDVITVIQTTAGGYPGEMRTEILDGTGSSLGAAFQPVAGAGTSFNGVCPGPMTYSSSTVAQGATTSIENCGTNEEIVRLQIVVTGNLTPLTLTQIQSNFQGTSAVSAIYTAKIYYSGTSPTFSSANLFGSATPTVATYNINGSQALVTGTNYFWLVYTLNNTGTVGNTVDGVISQFTLSSTNYTPTVTNPAGSRTIAACATYPSTSALGRKNWVKSDAGVSVSGSAVTSWADQSGAAITGNMVPVGAAATQPTVVTAGINYQNFIRFDGTDDGLRSNNAVTAVTSGLYSNSNNTVLLVKNIRTGGIPVDYKWETDGTGPTRIGFELNGSAQRFDFVDDGTGLNAASTTNITNKNYIVGGVVNATQSMVRLNGLIDGTISHGGLSMAGAGATTGYLYLGCNDITDWAYYSNVDIAEEMTFNKTLSTTELLMVESYLAVKYGITLGNTTSPSDYMSSNAGLIWYGQSAYHNNVIGIGRDDLSTLYQKQSHNADDSVRIYLSTLVATNAANAGTFSLDRSFVISGATTGKMCATASSIGEMPTGLAGCTLYSRLEREWKITRTNMAQNYNMDFKLGACGAPGSVTVSDLRLLVDDDGNFANGGTQCYYNGDGTGIVFTYSNPTITVSNISTAHIPNNATKFITIASINAATPLPVELLQFDATLAKNERMVDLTWTTQSEEELDYFMVQKLSSDNQWIDLDKVAATGNSTVEQDYATVDPAPVMGMNYYRLQQVDKNGSYTYSPVRSISLKPGNELLISPNPANTYVTLTSKGIANQEFTVYNEVGAVVIINPTILSDDSITFSTTEMASGVYFIRLSSDELQHYKLVVQH